MDYIKNLKVKDLRVLLFYHFRSEQLNGSTKKVELLEAVNDIFRKYWKGILYKGGGGYVVTNEAVREAGEDMGEIYILLV